MAADKNAAWESHSWMICRTLELDPEITLIQHTCRACGRNFVDEMRSGNLYAVHLGAARFNRLSDETTNRWLAEPCPGKRIESDAVDLKSRSD